MILRANSSLSAMRDSFTLTIKFPFSAEITVAAPPAMNPMSSRCLRTSGEPDLADQLLLAKCRQIQRHHFRSPPAIPWIKFRNGTLRTDGQTALCLRFAEIMILPRWYWLVFILSCSFFGLWGRFCKNPRSLVDCPATQQASLYELLNNSSITWQKDFCGPEPASYVNDDQFLLYWYVSIFIFEQIFNYKTLF